MTDEQNEYIVSAVFEYIQQANDRYLEYTRWPAPATETERSLHYREIINMGNAILIELAKNDGIEIEYNIAEYIKGLQS